MKIMRSKKAQNMTEVALVIAVAGLAFIAMEVYIRRGLQGKMKDLSDAMIGKEHSLYSSDVSGLEVLDMNSSAEGYSRSKVTTSEGGGRQMLRDEGASSKSLTHSEYAP
jgi:hypothetical protein